MQIEKKAASKAVDSENKVIVKDASKAAANNENVKVIKKSPDGTTVVKQTVKKVKKVSIKDVDPADIITYVGEDGKIHKKVVKKVKKKVKKQPAVAADKSTASKSTTSKSASTMQPAASKPVEKSNATGNVNGNTDVKKTVASEAAKKKVVKKKVVKKVVKKVPKNTGEDMFGKSKEKAVVKNKATNISDERDSFFNDVELLEDPLPAPRKHVKKNLDFDRVFDDDGDFDV